MTDKTLQSKAVNIKGKSYVLVSDRIIYFNENYPNGSIKTELISQPDAKMVIVKATITPDVKNPDRYFSDYSQATWGDSYINKTSALENCSTSAVGRALAYLGIGVIDSIASVDEINKAQTYQKPTYPKNSYVPRIVKKSDTFKKEFDDAEIEAGFEDIEGVETNY